MLDEFRISSPAYLNLLAECEYKETFVLQRRLWGRNLLDDWYMQTKCVNPVRGILLMDIRIYMHTSIVFGDTGQNDSIDTMFRLQVASSLSSTWHVLNIYSIVRTYGP
jgi:hypothetical protein